MLRGHRARVFAAAAGLMLGAVRLAAQQGIVEGTVRDAATAAPLAEAEVRLGTGAGQVTGPDGRFRLAGAEPGEATLTVRRIGYAPSSRVVRVPTDGTMEVEVMLDAAATTLAPMVVTASRQEQSLADVPAAVSVADSTVIKSGRTAGLHEVLRYTPGVQATSRFGGDDVNLSIRGSGIRTTFGVRGVAVLLDGVPITEPDGLTRLDLIELGAAKQVEVVRGPASALYGGVASGGAINIISRSGAESRGAQLRVQRGGFGFEKYDGAWGGTFDRDRGSVYVAGAHTYSDGFRDLSGNRMTRFTLRSDYRPGRFTRLGLEASTSSLDMSIPGALNEAELDANPNQAAATNIANRYARRDERFRAGLKLDQGFLEGGAAQASAYAFYGGRTIDHPIFQVIDQRLHRVQLGGRVRVPVDRRDDPRVQVTAGADYDNLFGIDRRFQNVGGERGAVAADGYLGLPNLGVYAQAEARLSRGVSLTAGLRHDRVRYNLEYYGPQAPYVAERTFSQTSPRATLTWRAAPGINLYTSVSRGFEVPTSGELTASPDIEQPLNADLEPKSLWNYEAGVKALLGRTLFVDAALFRASVRGEIISRTVQLQAGPRTVFENAGRSRQTGVELAATWLPLPWLDVMGSYTFADYVLTDFQALTTVPSGPTGVQTVLVDYSGNRLPGVPRHRAAGELRLRPAANLTAGVGAEWQGKTFVDNGNSESGTVYFRPFGAPNRQEVPFSAVPAYALVHLNASYRLGPTTLFGSVENLLDRRYVANITINDGSGRFYSAGAGRYVALGVSVSAYGGGL